MKKMTYHMKRSCAASFTASITLTVTVFIVFICKDYGQAMENRTTIACEETSESTVLENSTYKNRWEGNSFKRFSINICPPPQNSYFDFMNQIGENATLLDDLSLYFNRMHPIPLNANNFRGLHITRLTIYYALQTYYEFGTQILSIDFLDPLTNLQDLFVHGVQMPRVPEWSRIKSVHLGHGVSLGTFGGCDYLEEITITDWVVQVHGWLASCTKLKRLTLRNISKRSALNAVSYAKNIQYLTMRKCNLNTFNRNFFDLMPDLKELDLSENNLNFPTYRDVLFRDDLLNNINDVAMLLRLLPKLRILDLSKNSNLDICKYNRRAIQNNFSTGIEHPLLEELLLSGTKTKSLCTAVGALPSLTHLTLGEPFEATSIMFQELLVSKQPLIVDFDGNIKNIEFTEADYDILLTNKNNLSATTFITLNAKLELDCDCHHALFAKALREELVNVTLVHCLTHNTNLTLVPSELLECERFTCGNTSSPHSSCVCRRMYENNATTIDCRGKIVSEIPYVPNVNVIKVIAPQSLIQTLRQQDLPDTLMILDLTDNHITHMDEEQAVTLFSKPERRMNLSGNPIVCDCGNRAFIETIKQHHSQVEDYYNLTCTGGAMLINDVNTSGLCLKFSNGAVMAFSIASALIALGLLVRTFYYRYKTMICIYLYARGWCLCCIRENSLNADRPYDAFVSFCHADESLVSEQLVPQLEERGFKICIHYRDWVPGELIPTQIVRSVEASRRTIIVLSRSFLQSMWGLLEFRIALVRALKDSIARIILIVIDDVVDEDTLDGDLRSYVTTSTYMRWDDPWFWDKLKYAMPHNNQQPRVPHVPFSIGDRSAQ